MGGILYLLVLVFHSLQDVAYDMIEVATRVASLVGLNEDGLMAGYS
jgi:hypothetical protein